MQMDFLLSSLVLCIVLWLAQRWLLSLKSGSRTAPLPPSPKGDLFIGHARDMVRQQYWRTFGSWAKTIGDILLLRVFGRNIIILNKFEHAQELLEKRGSTFSDRPRMVVITELMKIIAVTFLPYGDRWRQHRRLMHKYFNSRAVTTFYPEQRREVLELLSNLLKTPVEFQMHTKRFTASTIMSVTYGHSVTTDDRYVLGTNFANLAVNESGTPGVSLIDLFPPLKYAPSFMPGCAVNGRVQSMRALVRDMTNKPFQLVIDQREEGIASPSFVTRMLSDYEQSHVTDKDHIQVMKEVAASLYRAGSVTTATVLLTFFFAMMTHPRVARRAQQEIDELLNGERLPTFEDRQHLPYTNCILKELLRWNPPFPMGLPHRGIRDDEIDGKYIPQGSTVLANIWYMMHDERNYENPDSFIPERFQHGFRDHAVLDPALAVFGFGRRICPGRHFAEASLWLATSNILAAFDILPPLNEKGEEEMPEPVFAKGFKSALAPFKCRIIPRNDRAASIVESRKGVIG